MCLKFITMDMTSVRKRYADLLSLFTPHFLNSDGRVHIYMVFLFHIGISFRHRILGIGSIVKQKHGREKAE